MNKFLLSAPGVDDPREQLPPEGDCGVHVCVNLILIPTDISPTKHSLRRIPLAPCSAVSTDFIKLRIVGAEGVVF